MPTNMIEDRAQSCQSHQNNFLGLAFVFCFFLLATPGIALGSV